MNLFGEQVDKAVKSPNVREWDELERKLKKNVAAAKRSGNAITRQHALDDYQAHYNLKDAYVSAGLKQYSIFDV